MLAFETSRGNYSPDVSNLHLKNAFEKNDCRIQVKSQRELSHSLVTRIWSELSAKAGVRIREWTNFCRDGVDAKTLEVMSYAASFPDSLIGDARNPGTLKQQLQTS